MKTKDTPKQYVIYSRKSKFTGKGESIENQIELCRQYIAMHFGEEAAENVLVYEDEGFSGGNLERPQFKKMMKDSQKIAFAAIVVYRLDRISRNIGDFAGLIEEFDWEGNKVWELKVNSKKGVFHHGMQRLPNGNTMVIAWEYKTREEAIAKGRKPETLGEMSINDPNWPVEKPVEVFI